MFQVDLMRLNKFNAAGRRWNLSDSNILTFTGVVTEVFHLS